MAFLPTGYVEPTGGGGGGKYLKLKKDETVKVRILSENPLMGWEYWTIDGKPKRLAAIEGTPHDIRRDADGKPERPKFFWCVIVWNYGDESVQVWNITQATIRRSIEALCGDEDFGDPKGYDLKISRKGEGLDTEYTVLPGKVAPFANSEAIQDAAKVNLNNWFAGGDPFSSEPAPGTQSHPESSDFSKEFWQSISAAELSRDVAADILVRIGCKKPDGSPTTEGMTEAQYKAAMEKIDELIPF